MIRFGLISSKEMDDFINNSAALIIDVRDEEDYNIMHFDKSINCPMDMLEKENFPRNKILVFYCENGGTGILAAKEMFDKGYITRALVGGIKGYKGNNIIYSRY